MSLSSLDIDAPRWDQSTFTGRLKHFFNITDCRTALLSDSRLDEAKALVESCRLETQPGLDLLQLVSPPQKNVSPFCVDVAADNLNEPLVYLSMPAAACFSLKHEIKSVAVMFFSWLHKSEPCLLNMWLDQKQCFTSSMLYNVDNWTKKKSPAWSK